MPRGRATNEAIAEGPLAAVPVACDGGDPPARPLARRRPRAAVNRGRLADGSAGVTPARRTKTPASLEGISSEQDRAGAEQAAMHAEATAAATQQHEDHLLTDRAASVEAILALERIKDLEKQQEATDKWQDRQNGALVRLADGQARMNGVVDCMEEKVLLHIQNFENKIESSFTTFKRDMREDLKRIFLTLLGVGGSIIAGLIGTIITLVVTHHL